MIIAGCDPGQTGAIAFLEDGRVTVLYDMPVMARAHGKGQEINGAELASIFLEHKPEITVIEAVSAMPGQGVSSTFRFGESFGVLKGVLQALQIPYRIVTPQAWKKQCGLNGKKDKDLSRSLAIQQHPEVSDMLARKKDHGRADAIFIGKAK